MVENRICSFCGEAIEPGTGKMFVRKDGTVFTFCSNKCQKNNIHLGRVNRRTRWTTRYAELKHKGMADESEHDEKPAKDSKPEERKQAKPKAQAKKSPAKKAAPAEKPATAKKEKPEE